MVREIQGLSNILVFTKKFTMEGLVVHLNLGRAPLAAVVAVDQDYGEYGECNAVLGQYQCRCGPFTKMHPCNASVGRADVSTRYDGVRPPAEDWKWWRVNLAKKIGGYWYSTIKDGECSADASSTCTWKVLSEVRTITSRCLLNHAVGARGLRQSARGARGPRPPPRGPRGGGPAARPRGAQGPEKPGILRNPSLETANFL